MFFMDSLYKLKSDWRLNGVLELISLINRAQRGRADGDTLVNRVVTQILDTVIEVYDFHDFKKESKETFSTNTIETKHIIRELEGFVDLNDQNQGKISLIREKLKTIIDIDQSLESVDIGVKDIIWSQVPKHTRQTVDFNVKVLLGELPDGKRVAKKTYFLKTDLNNLNILTEIKILKKLSKNIRNEESCFLQYYGHELRDNCITIYMEGHQDSLNDYLKELENKGLKLSKVQIRAFIGKLIDAYVEMENLGIVHKDIKPENLLISDDRRRLKIIDFSVSKKGEWHLAPGIHPIKGTKHYMAPEIFSPYINNKSTSEYSPIKADVFSLGLTFYKMATLERTCFLNKGSTQVLIDHLNGLDLEQWVKLLLVGMLEPNYQARKSFKDCLKHLEDEETHFN